LEAIKQTVKISKNHEVRIKVPEYFPENEIVDVILIFKKKPEDFKKKIDNMREAMKDKLFLSDLSEISEDFKVIDQESWSDDGI
jgi:hypothetical protein